MNTRTETLTAQEQVQTASPGSSSSWGSQLAQRLPPSILAILGHVRRGAIFAPTLVVTLLLMFMGTQHYFKQGYAGHAGIAGFAQVNDWGAQIMGRPELASGSKDGYDGQFSYYIAYRPSVIVTCAYTRSTCPTNQPVFRWQRVLYPMTAWLLAFGRSDLVPYTLVLVNFLAILVTVIVVGQLAVDVGASRWLGAAAGLFCGEVLSFLGDLTDAYSVMWMVVAIYLLRRNRFLWGAFAIAAALLSREALILYLPFLSLPLLVQRRWLTVAQSALIALGPFVAWQIVLRVLYGAWGLLSGDTSIVKFVSLPFLGFYQTRRDPDFPTIAIFVAVPVVATCAIAVLAVWQHGPADLLREPLPLMSFTYCLLLSMTGEAQWNYFWGPTRLAVPGVVLGVIVASRLPSAAVRAGYATLIAFTSLSLLFVVWAR